MAVGFPAKTTYVDGDVFSASDINDTNGTLNLVNPATTSTVQSNPILNSAFQVWQRGTSIANPAAYNYAADRWQMSRQGVAGETVSRQVTGDTTNLPNIQYCARVQRDSGNTSTNNVQLMQSLESINSIPFVGKTITVSLYARRGANFSAASNAFSFGAATGTGTDQSLASTGFTGAAYPVAGTATLTTTWQRFTVTGTLSSSATQIGLYTAYVPVGTAGAADYYEVTGVQIDIGSVALPFRTYAGTIQGELAACCRYFQVLNGQQNQSWASAGSATVVARYFFAATGLRQVTPTVTLVGTPQLYDGGSTINISSVSSIGSASVGGVHFNVNVASGLSTFRPYTIYANAGEVQISAEL
jgi:hypothetical protein